MCNLCICRLEEVLPLTYSFHRCLLHALGPLLTFFPAALDYSIMLKVGRSCLFSLLYLCTCHYHAVTKYMAASHRSLCNTFTHGLERGQLIGRLLFFFMKPNRSVSKTSLLLSASYLSWSRQQHVWFGLRIYQYFICVTWQLSTSPLRIINQLHSSSLHCTAF